ncbi:SH3 domain-containing protein [Solimonas sp. SE-A11]|uniref:SH3 domain-containing protein n=1 Tax=Solimonas sp. SE-A11 TaxID=3054954 RepID=UPI00259CA25E|nr:SH3 domain-containing protein [Solimonas sp. SE-A11]MDM4772608.1 SH3 domain-containing protein [Solimonas sp. SE-A11]
MINVRAQPDLGSGILGVLNQGEAVTVLAEHGEFVRLRTPGGTEGYLKHKYLLNYAGPRPAPVAPPPVAAPATPPVEIYRSPYPAVPLAGTPTRSPVSSVPPPPMTFLTTGAGAGIQFTAGVGSAFSSQSREGLRRDLAREGYAGEVDKLDRAVPGGFLRVGYGLSAPWKVEVALSYIDDFDVYLSSTALTPITLAQSVEDHAPASGFGLAPTLGYGWNWPGSAMTLRAGGYFSLGNETQVRLNGRPLDVDYQTHSWLAGVSWETAGDSGIWYGLDLQVMDLNELAGLVAVSLRWGN